MIMQMFSHCSVANGWTVQPSLRQSAESILSPLPRSSAIGIVENALAKSVTAYLLLECF